VIAAIFPDDFATCLYAISFNLDGFLPALIIYPAKRNEQEQRWNGESDSRRCRGNRGRLRFLVHSSNSAANVRLSHRAGHDPLPPGE